jgi:two-component system LytT family response regulator
MIRVLIVDDEALGRRALVRMLRGHPSFTVVGECREGDAALEEVQRLRPDLVFLDVQMPARNGLEVAAEMLHTFEGAIIFVTAYDKYALEAFEVHAQDYLLKPFTEERLARALKRVETTLEKKMDSTAVERLLSEIRAREAQPRYLERIPATRNGRIQLIAAAEIERIDAMGNYAKLHTKGSSFEIRETLQTLESRLDPARFVRVHRSTIVNLDCVREVQKWFGGGHLVVMKDGTEVRLSRYQTEAVARLTGK